MLRRGMMAAAAGGAGAAAVYSEIMADSPEFYVRLNELSGTNANNETGGTDGTIGAGVGLGSVALYAGGLPSMGFSPTISTSTINMTSAYPASTGDISFMAIIKPLSTTGMRPIISKDDSSGSRSFQWRQNGANLEWVKIVGGVQTVTKTAIITTAAQMLHVTVSAAGAVTFYRNGVSVHTASIAAANYSTSNTLRIGWAGGPAASFNGNACEVAGFGAVLSSARIAAHAAAAGF